MVIGFFKMTDNNTAFLTFTLTETLTSPSSVAATLEMLGCVSMETIRSNDVADCLPFVPLARFPQLLYIQYVLLIGFN